MGQVEALPWGQTGRACVCTHVNERARYPARPGSRPCVLPPEAFGTSQAALFLSPTAKREGERAR